MKPRDRTKKKKLSLRDRLTRRKTHRLAAHVSREDQWDHDAPNIRLSRAFVVVVVLHIVAVGGILVFEVLKPDGRAGASLADRPDGLAPDNARISAAAIPEEMKIGDPRVEGLEPYIVRAGDTVQSIANRHGIPRKAIESQNGLDRGGRIYPGRHLFIPNKESAVAATNPVAEATRTPGANTANDRAAAVDKKPVVAVSDIPLPAPPVAPARQTLIPQVAAATPAQAPVPKPEPELKPKPEPEAVRPRFAVTETPSPDPRPAAKPVRPVSGTGSGVYVMAGGDTPYGIARRYGIDVDQLLRANNISDATNIQIGQKLKIPKRR